MGTYAPSITIPTISQRKICLQQLINSLKRCLLSYDYTKALGVLDVLLSTGEIQFDLIWKQGVETLRGLSEHDKCLRFLQIMHNYAPVHQKQAVLAELLRYQIGGGKIEDAFRDSESHIYLSPYINSSLLHGYLSMLNISIAHSESSTEVSKQILPKDSEMDLDEDDHVHLSYYASVKRPHLLQARDFICKAINSISADEMLLQYYEHLMSTPHDSDAVEIVLKKFRDNNPNNPIAQRRLFEFYYQKGASNVEWEEPAREFLLLDPLSEPHVALIPYLQRRLASFGEQLLNRDLEDILEILFVRVEHGDEAEITLLNLSKVLLILRGINEDIYQKMYLGRVKVLKFSQAIFEHIKEF